MIKLHNNGYVVKGMYKNGYTSLIENYRGIDSFVSWPLDEYGDLISKKLNEEAWDKWFSYHGVLDVVPERDYLSRYITHCKKLGINTMVLEVETQNDNQIALDSLNVIEVLGFDCILGTQISYLNLNPDYFKTHFPEIYLKLNQNRLLSSINEIYEFLNTYNILLEKGENLEYGDNPVAARLSVVDL